MFQGAGSNPVGSTAFPAPVGKVARRSRTGDLLKLILTSPLNLTIIISELDGFMPRAECGPGFCFFARGPGTVLIVILAKSRAVERELRMSTEKTLCKCGHVESSHTFDPKQSGRACTEQYAGRAPNC